MIYDVPPPADRIDQGDIIDGCPVIEVRSATSVPTVAEPVRVIVLTQTCDLANDKVTAAVVAVVLDAQGMVDAGRMKPADIRGPLRSGRIWGLYFLPAHAALGLPEMIADFRRLHTVRLDLLGGLCRAGNRRGRVKPLYREHLSKHFADGYCRIGLPQEIVTQ